MKFLMLPSLTLVTLLAVPMLSGKVYAQSPPTDPNPTLSRDPPAVDELDTKATELQSFSFHSSEQNRTGSRRLLSDPDTESWKILWSPRAINTTSGIILRTVPAPKQDLRALFERAIADAKSHPAADLTNSFTSTANGMRLFMTSIDERPTRDSFNWVDYAAVAKVLLKFVIDQPDTENSSSIVGVVLDPSGRKAVDIVSLPAYVHVRLNRSVEFSESAADPPRKRAIEWRVSNTQFSLRLKRVAYQVQAQVLLKLVEYVLDMVITDINYRSVDSTTGYNIVETAGRLANDVANNPIAKKLIGDAAFHLHTIGPNIQATDMMDLLVEIRRVVQYQIRNNARGDRVSALTGQVLNAAGFAVARWSLGLPGGAASSVCMEALVVNPDGSQALGCLASDES
ncbi:MAG: hypothetical protein M1817_004302 [Caeruleum heppii]|nr:MAG: hypothetical protein M1817_004302 [Caeruleum heppii]